MISYACEPVGLAIALTRRTRLSAGDVSCALSDRTTRIDTSGAPAMAYLTRKCPAAPAGATPAPPEEDPRDVRDPIGPLGDAQHEVVILRTLVAGAEPADRVAERSPHHREM